MFTCPECGETAFVAVQLIRHEHKIKQINEPEGIEPGHRYYQENCEVILTGESSEMTESEWFVECESCGERFDETQILDDWSSD